MARPRRSGPRTRSGRLSRAYQGPARDTGTPELCAKRAYLINGSDPQLAATASGILLANGFIDRQRHDAAMVYAWAHALTYGRPWRQVCPLGERAGGRERPDELLERAKDLLEEMNGRLTPEQRLAVANVAVFGFIPQWLYAARLKLRPLPSDQAERVALLEGLAALARP